MFLNLAVALDSRNAPVEAPELFALPQSTSLGGELGIFGSFGSFGESPMSEFFSEQSSEPSTLDTPSDDGLADDGLLVAPFDELAVLLRRLAKKGKVLEAMALLHGATQVIELHHCNSFLQACAVAGDVPSASSFLAHMETFGPEPNLESYNRVLNATAVNGAVAVMSDLVNRIVTKGLAPTLVTFGTICKVFARSGDVASIKVIIEFLKARGETLNEYFYASLITACGQHSPVKKDEVLEALRMAAAARGLNLKLLKKIVSQVLDCTGIEALGLIRECQQSAYRGKKQQAKASSSARSRNGRCATQRPKTLLLEAGPLPRAGDEKRTTSRQQPVFLI
eukprot:TRINITY_DN63309_c0_g1_i2.p1 TRINITY_DN63309_c0_g1~~TRINITY_DN63309_c0_g1_i2.p1  ORF type:complete len:338 (+),score=88.76 TRINITY_DN63309_c0_g1_i2:144-1157(+)